MTTRQLPARQQHVQVHLHGIVLAAALLLAIGDAGAAPVATGQRAADDTAGEAQAQAYFAQHRTDFATPAPVITQAQAAAALAQGDLEGQRAKRLRTLDDGSASQ
jgi:hypothetical protein